MTGLEKTLKILYKHPKMSRKVKVAAIQAEPCWNDLKAGVGKTITLINEAASKGANVIGFPEVWLSGYPW
jgi:nitrilase